MRLRTLAPIVAVASLGCMGDGGAFQELTREQRLPSGKAVKIVSCQFAWGVEHHERHPTQDGFAVE